MLSHVLKPHQSLIISILSVQYFLLLFNQLFENADYFFYDLTKSLKVHTEINVCLAQFKLGFWIY